MDRIHPEDKGRVLEQARDSLDKGSGVIEYRFRRNDGSYRWMHDDSRIYPVRFTGKTTEGGEWSCFSPGLLVRIPAILVESGLKAIGAQPLELRLGSVLSFPWRQASRAMPD